MSTILRVSLVQSVLYWENSEANKAALTNYIEQLKGQTDLIILPEMFTSGFTMAPQKVAETMSGSTVYWMKSKAAQLNAAIVGSLVIEEGGNYYNRLLWVNPDGTIFHYDKRHLFTLAGEHKSYTSGKRRLIVEYKGWKICPLICYDLRFPVWSRNDVEYDMLVFVANWPTPRIHHWDHLLIGRAIENQCYTLGVNRVGEDKNGLQYCGHSAIVDFNGKLLIRISNQEAVFTAKLSKNDLLAFRQKLPFLEDRDAFHIME